MADQLATPEDLAALLLRDDIDVAKATILAEIGTAVVQAAAGGQRIVYVADDTFDVMGTPSVWLPLPQIPVAKGDVTTVTIDGVAVSDWKQFGARLWRRCGWSPCSEPTEVGGVYSHGLAPGRQELQLGRGAVLSICKGVYGNSAGVAAATIDDYSVTYDRLAAQLEASQYLRAALRAQYGRGAGIVRVG
jgi:hypothetical protein